MVLLGRLRNAWKELGLIAFISGGLAWLIGLPAAFLGGVFGFFGGIIGWLFGLPAAIGAAIAGNLGALATITLGAVAIDAQSIPLIMVVVGILLMGAADPLKERRGLSDDVGAAMDLTGAAFIGYAVAVKLAPAFQAAGSALF
jgi:hypothetical protein